MSRAETLKSASTCFRAGFYLPAAGPMPALAVESQSRKKNQMTCSNDGAVATLENASVVGNVSIQPIRNRTMLRRVPSDKSPSISPTHPDTDLLALGERFDRAVVKMNAATKRSNALCVMADKRACKMAGISYPPPDGSAGAFIDRLAKASSSIPGFDAAQDLTTQMTDDVGYLYDEIAKLPSTTFEGACVHARALKEMFAGDDEYDRKVVHRCVDAILGAAVDVLMSVQGAGKLKNRAETNA